MEPQDSGAGRPHLSSIGSEGRGLWGAASGRAVALPGSA